MNPTWSTIEKRYIMFKTINKTLIRWWYDSHGDLAYHWWSIKEAQRRSLKKSIYEEDEITLRDKMRNENIGSRTKGTDKAQVSLKLQWTGHIAWRTLEKRWR